MILARWACLASALAAWPAGADPLLTFPVDCTLGKTCYIQNYVDQDAGSGWADYACGALSYDGHKGADIALLTRADMAGNVTVRAAAPGVVRGVRDGMADTGLDETTRDALKGRECGNGVVVGHGNGWQTQYCHLKNGSIRVEKGQRVTTKTVLGEIGLSGWTEFPHVHVSVRHKGKVVDPFDPDQTSACSATPARTLWKEMPEYVAGGLLDIGFAAGLPDYADVKAGTAAEDAIAPDAPALVLFAFGYGARTGDIIHLRVDGPRGAIVDREAVIKRDRAQFLRSSGRKLGARSWRPGTYEGTAIMRRDGRDISRLAISIRVE